MPDVLVVGKPFKDFSRWSKRRNRRIEKQRGRILFNSSILSSFRPKGAFPARNHAAPGLQAVSRPKAGLRGANRTTAILPVT
jgi:hypothetical protein